MTEGLGKFSQEEFDELDFDEYRRRFPHETKFLTNEQIWNVVSKAEDDYADDEWRALFKGATNEQKA